MLCQTYEDKMIFYFSENQKQFTEAQLKKNILKLLPPLEHVQEFIQPDDIIAEPELLIYRRIEHQFECDRALKWFSGTVLSFNRESNLFREQYDDEDESYSFSSLDDLKTDDLRVLG